jgi:biotin carboxyl carrier protein
MTFEIEVAGRARRVTIEPAGATDQSGGRFRVVLDDVTCVVDARRTDLGWSIVYADDRRSLDVAVTQGTRGDMFVQFPHLDVRVGVDGRRFRGDPLDGSRSAKESHVAAPMPGRVVRVLVKPGDDVAARQGLVIIEAMKMENELRAGRDGVVVELPVSGGQSVEAGTLIAVVGNAAGAASPAD